MRNCLILGSGRSGTSLAAGMLSKAGYFMGNRLSQERVSNEITNFEDKEINSINEELLSQLFPQRFRLIDNYILRHKPKQWQRWLARVPMGVDISPTHNAVKKIQELVQHEPYCFKDPRLSYVFPVWKPYLKNTVFVCIFRHPDITAKSILRLCKKASYLKSFSINYQQAIEVWTLMYKHILSYCHEDEWLFIHYDQLINEQGYSKLANFLDASVDTSIIDNSFKRPDISRDVPKPSLEIYGKLCNLADFKD